MPSPNNPPKGAHILVVDDIADNRNLLVRRLSHRNYQCTEARDGFEALGLLKRHAFDLVLLDVSMPGMSGLDVLAQMRKHFFQTQLPIIMVTADAQPETIASAKASGANDYILKPINFSSVLSCIETNLDLSRTSMQINEARRELRLARQALA